MYRASHFFAMVIGMVLAMSVLLHVSSKAVAEEAEAAPIVAVDYSCLHEASWLMNGGEVNSVFQSPSDVLSKAVVSAKGSQLFSVSFNQIPAYYHNFSEADVAALNSRPKAASDFKSSSGTTAVAGQVLEFGSDLGYNSSSC
eukprot:gene32825-43879_t